MAFVLGDLIRETTTTTSTGSYTLAGPVAGYRAFDDVYDTGDTCWYVATMGSDFEIALGTFTAPSTLARTTVLKSSNANAAVNWGAGTKKIYVAVPAEYLLILATLQSLLDAKAPSSPDFLVKTADGVLSAERVVTDTATIAADWATAGQAKFNVVDASITLAKMANLAANKLIGSIAGGVPEAIDLTGTGRSLIAAANEAAVRTFLGLVIGTNVQAFATALSAIGALTPANNKVAYFDGASSASLADLTSFARSILDDADARAARTTLVAKHIVQIKVEADATVLTIGDGKLYFCIPSELNGMDLVDADAFVSTVSSSGTPTIQIHNLTDTVDMLSTRITIDASERTSYTAATAPVINAAADDVATGDILRIDVDVAGTGAKGLGVILVFN